MIDIRKARNEELSGLIPVYKETFSKHGIFTKSPEDILDYLENAKGDFIVAFNKADNTVVGGILLTIKEPDTGHRLGRIRHLAVSKEFQGKGIGKGLMMEAQRMLGPGKMEIHVSENETEALEFYKHMRYEVEGKLKNHYRKDETCYIVGKITGED